MKKSVYSVVLGAASLLALTACMQTVQGDAPGELNRKKVLWLRGDGMAIQRYEGCTRPANMSYGESADGEHRWKHHRHHHHGVKAAAAKAEAKADAKAAAKKEDVKKEEKKSDKKDSK